MSFSFGKASLSRLNTCHKDIQAIMYELIKIYDVSVFEGIRSTERQLMLYNKGNSQLDGVHKKSKHQGSPDEDGNIVSYAIDMVPYKKGHPAFTVSQDNYRRFYFMMGLVYSIANRLYNEGIITHRVRFGLDWQMDMVYRHKSEFLDLPHWELIK